jgi:hypothetical protein
MRRATPIVTLHNDGPSQEWHRFTAALCLMSSYTIFVRAGHTLWTKGLNEWHRGQPDRWFYTSLAGLFMAIVMYLCGRSLWRGGRWSRFWLIAAFAAILGSTWTTVSYQPFFHYYGPLNGYSLGGRVSESLGYAIAFAQDVPFLAVLCFSARKAGPGAQRPKQLRIWVQLAAAWCLLSSLLVILGGDFAYYLRSVLDPFHVAFLAVPLAFILPAGAGVLLIADLRAAARWLALVVAATVIATAFLNGYVISLLVKVAIDAFLISGIPGPLPDWSPYPFGCFLANQTFYMSFFVDTVLRAGPWILVAIYARKYPLRVPPDDGSPFPRHYCGHCGYNLHGITHEVCPECGRRLTAG